MSQPKSDAQPCQCGSGNFCRRHGRYGSHRPAPEGTADRLESFHFQRCGGGRRIIRKLAHGSNLDY